MSDILSVDIKYEIAFNFEQEYFWQRLVVLNTEAATSRAELRRTSRIRKKEKLSNNDGSIDDVSMNDAGSIEMDAEAFDRASNIFINITDILSDIDIHETIKLALKFLVQTKDGKKSSSACICILWSIYVWHWEVEITVKRAVIEE